jgi:site-specific recombinase XerC
MAGFQSGEVSELADEHDLGTANREENVKQLLEDFLNSRRQGSSPRTITYYRQCLTPFITFYRFSPGDITEFLTHLKCNAGGKFSYYRAIRAFGNWLVKNDYLKQNPIYKVDPPKPGKPILPSLSEEQVNYLIDFVHDLKHKTIISLFADSGMRLNELAGINASDINWDNYNYNICGIY